MIALQLPLPGDFAADQRRLVRLLSGLVYDDALQVGLFRVTYNRLAGRAHFRVYRRKRLIGVVEITTARKLDELRFFVACWLVRRGCVAEGAQRVEFGGAARITARQKMPKLVAA